MRSTGLFNDTIAFGVALLLSLVLTPAIRNFALSHHFVDVIGSVRKVHTRSVPRLGGVAIVLAWLCAAGFVLALQPSLQHLFWELRPRTTVFVAGAIAAAGLGMVDDIRGVRARYKLVVQLGIGALLCWGGFTVHELQLPGDVHLPLGPLAVPFTMLWVAGVMNAMNLIDGLDGLAAGVAVIALGTTLALALATGKLLLALYTAAMLGAVGGFLVFNFNPASIFMGDAGSLFLGYFLSVVMLFPSRGRSGAVLEVAVPVAILGVPILDTVLAIARRALRGRGLFSPDRAHIHHRLLALGLTQRQAVLALYAASLVLALCAVAMGYGDRRLDVIICVALLAAVLVSLRLLGVFDVRVKALRLDRQRNMQLRQTVHHIATKLEKVARIDDVFESIHQFAPAVAASACRGHIGSVSFEHPPVVFSEPSFEARFSLEAGTRQVGDVVLIWGDGRQRLEDEQALAIEEICQNAARAVLRVSPQLMEHPLAPATLETAPTRRRPATR